MLLYGTSLSSALHGLKVSMEFVRNNYVTILRIVYVLLTMNLHGWHQSHVSLGYYVLPLSLAKTSLFSVDDYSSIKVIYNMVLCYCSVYHTTVSNQDNTISFIWYTSLF